VPIIDGLVALSDSQVVLSCDFGPCGRPFELEIKTCSLESSLWLLGDENIEATLSMVASDRLNELHEETAMHESKAPQLLTPLRATPRLLAFASWHMPRVVWAKSMSQETPS
jgi:hypothetical protein